MFGNLTGNNTENIALICGVVNQFPIMNFNINKIQIEFKIPKSIQMHFLIKAAHMTVKKGNFPGYKGK